MYSGNVNPQFLPDTSKFRFAKERAEYLEKMRGAEKAPALPKTGDPGDMVLICLLVLLMTEKEKKDPFLIMILLYMLP